MSTACHNSFSTCPVRWLWLWSSAILLAVTPATWADDPPDDGTEFEAMLAEYGNLSTVAGRGLNGDGNWWLSTYEGGDPRAAELSVPHMAMADVFGRIYIADKESEAILRVTPGATPAADVIETVAGNHVRGDGVDTSAAATSVSLYWPNGLYVFPDGTFYILDLGNGKIRRVNPDGMMQTICEDPDGIAAGRGLWVAPDESLIYYSSGTRVRRWTPGGGVETVATGFSNLGNLTVDPGGSLVVTDNNPGHRVYRIGAGGSKAVIAGDGSESNGGSGSSALQTGIERVRGIAFRPDGTYFLACQKRGVVWYVDSAGIIHLFIGGDRSGNAHAGDGGLVTDLPFSKMAEPRAISIAPNGDLLITTNDNGFIRRVKSLCPPPVPERLQVDPPSEPGIAVVLRWPSTPGQAYIVESSDSLAAGSWVSEAVVSGAAGASETSHAVAAGEGRAVAMFRVRVPR